jgi:hypothetical protein
MNKTTKYLFLLLLPLAISFADGPAFIDQYLKGKIHVDYPYQITHGSEYTVFAAKEDTVEQLLPLLDDVNYKAKWPHIISMLGTLSVGYDVPLAPMIKATEGWENSPTLNPKEKLKYIEKAYWALALEGSKESLDFLKERTQEEFWQGREMPTYTEVIDHSDAPPLVFNARSEAILAIGTHPLEAAERFLEKLHVDPGFYNDTVLRKRIESQLRMRASWMRQYEKRVRAFKVKRELSGESPSSEISKQAIPDISPAPSTPEVEEVAQKSTAPEPATVKSSEVKTAEPIEGPVEQSSNWWLWLIGAVVVVGGLGLVLRRKS